VPHAQDHLKVVEKFNIQYSIILLNLTEKLRYLGKIDISFNVILIIKPLNRLGLKQLGWAISKSILTSSLLFKKYHYSPNKKNNDFLVNVQ